MLLHIKYSVIMDLALLNYQLIYFQYTLKPVLSGHSKRTQKIGFQYRLSVNAGQKYCKMGSIIKYFPPSLSYHFLLRLLICLFLCGHLRKVLLYTQIKILKLMPNSKHICATKVNVQKFQTLFSFCSRITCWVSGLGFTKCLPD